MKKIFFITGLALLWGLSADAQPPHSYKLTVEDSPYAPSYALPYTTVKVRVVMEKETVLAGPYARFAQNYFGTVAPLSDRETYTIKSASLDYSDPDRTAPLPKKDIFTKEGRRTVSHVNNRSEFLKVSPDRLSSADKSTEQMAKEAAEMIFKLRRTRLDLITGEVGENVYGEGLKSALNEIARLENEYLALFFGKQTVTTTVKEFDVIPDAGKNSYIVFRYSAAEGFLPADDLGGNPVVLMLNPENRVAATATAGGTKKAGSYYRVADWVNCKVVDGNKDLAAKRIPVYQFGATVSGK